MTTAAAGPTIDQDDGCGATTDLDSSVPVQTVLVDVVSGPHTIVALGEDCLVCEEGLEPGQVYVFVHVTHRGGVAHESCTDNAGQALALPR